MRVYISIYSGNASIYFHFIIIIAYNMANDSVIKLKTNDMFNFYFKLFTKLENRNL